jgi:hypothetical protein
MLKLEKFKVGISEVCLLGTVFALCVLFEISLPLVVDTKFWN